MNILRSLRNLMSSVPPDALTLTISETPKVEHRVDNGGGYNGGLRGIRGMTDWNPLNLSGNAAVLRNRKQIVSRSHDLYRNAPIARGAISKRVTRVVGTGLTYHSRIDAKALGMTDEQAEEWQENAEREFEYVAKTADLTREANFYELSDLAFRTTLLGGDGLTIFTGKKYPGDVYGTKIQLVEGERICNPNDVADRVGLEAGVEMDESGAVVAYHVLNQHPGNLQPGVPKRWQRVPAFADFTGRRTAKLLYFRERPGQYRGIPMLAPLIEPLQKLDKFSDSTLMNAIVSSLFTVFLETSEGDSIPGIPGEFSPNEGEDAEGLPTKPVSEPRMGTGNVVELPKGAKPNFAQPSNPNPNFDPFFQGFVSQFAMALGEPPESLMGAYKSSYSAARAALQDLWSVIKVQREWLISNFCQLFLEAWMDEAVAIGRILAPGYFDDPAIRMAYLGADWVGDAPPSLDPKKEAEASALKVDKGLSDRATEIAANSGRSWTSVVRQLAREKKEMDAAGLTPVPQPGAAAPTNQPGADNSDDDTGDTEGDETE